jgi:hypothetical protein
MMPNEKITVLTPNQLAKRWQVSTAKIYEDNNTGKLPRLPNNRTRFPLAAIEEMERGSFDKNDIKTHIERRLRRENEDLNKIIELKNEEISRLMEAIAKINAFTTEFIYVKKK